jgi:endonuclease-3
MGKGTSSAEDIKKILRLLEKEYPEPATALRFKTPFELLVATVLSAMATDKKVNEVTFDLFKKYKKVADYAAAKPAAFQKDVSSINFYRNKAKNIQAAAQMVLEEFGGTVPDTMEELLKLPGVARKTANIILSNAFGKNEGIAVDTHVKRLSQRLGLTKNTKPEKIEEDLMKITPRKEWGNLSHLLILHGRAVCAAKKPLHDKCVLYDLCPSRGI